MRIKNAKPCPFCGCKDIEASSDGSEKFWFVECSGCGVFMSEGADGAELSTMKAAEEAWNRRSWPKGKKPEVKP